MHIYLSHNFTNIGNMELECRDCLKLFTFAKLKEHKRQVHSTKKCELCNRDVSAGNFMRHKKSCKPIDPLLENQCNVCNKANTCI